MSVEVRLAATVVVVRDRASGEGLEVLVQRRNPAMVFAPGAVVFPGGALDDTDDELAATVGPPLRGGHDHPRGPAMLAAAVRECFEEVGLLFARHRDQLVSGDEEWFAAATADVRSGRRSLSRVCHDHELRLATDELRWFGHWITPPGAPRRYDTRFFVAPAPGAQPVHHDRDEAVEAGWASPGRLLEACAGDGAVLMHPTERTLRALEPFSRVSELLNVLDAAGTPPDTLVDGIGRRVVLPADVFPRAHSTQGA